MQVLPYMVCGTVTAQHKSNRIGRAGHSVSEPPHGAYQDAPRTEYAELNSSRFIVSPKGSGSLELTTEERVWLLSWQGVNLGLALYIRKHTSTKPQAKTKSLTTRY